MGSRRRYDELQSLIAEEEVDWGLSGLDRPDWTGGGAEDAEEEVEVVAPEETEEELHTPQGSAEERPAAGMERPQGQGGNYGDHPGQGG